VSEDFERKYKSSKRLEFYGYKSTGIKRLSSDDEKRQTMILSLAIFRMF